MSRGHGFLNIVPQVHKTSDIDAAESYYGGTSSLGKSDIAIYTSNFVHADSINRVTPRDIANRFYSDRLDLVNTASNTNDPDRDHNPDFPKASVQFNYSAVQASSYNGIKIKGNEQSAGNNSLKSKPTISSTTSTTNLENVLATIDLSGRYSPNLNISGLDFNGNVSSPSRTVNGASGGGYGSDREIPQENGVTTIQSDIHDNSISRNDSSIDRGVLQIVELDDQDQPGTSERGVLGAFKSRAYDYDATTILQS